MPLNGKKDGGAERQSKYEFDNEYQNTEKNLLMTFIKNLRKI